MDDAVKQPPTQEVDQALLGSCACLVAIGYRLVMSYDVWLCSIGKKREVSAGLHMVSLQIQCATTRRKKYVRFAVERLAARYEQA